jgi:hypothetical protein
MAIDKRFAPKKPSTETKASNNNPHTTTGIDKAKTPGTPPAEEQDVTEQTPITNQDLVSEDTPITKQTSTMTTQEASSSEEPSETEPTIGDMTPESTAKKRKSKKSKKSKKHWAWVAKRGSKKRTYLHH